ncbi:MAG: HAD family phosphatase [Planctomycetales bacterium]|nr:HAD family phosphatase [Planctomycetales bacterium]
MQFPTSARFDLVICDVDGCLSPESSAPWDLASIAEVARHNRRAIEQRDRPIVTLCTGRPEPFAEAMCRAIGNDVAPCVAENGAWLFFPDRNGFSLDPAITPEQREIVHLASRRMHELYGPQGVTQQPGKAAAVTLYHEDPQFLRSICDDVRAEFERNAWPFRISMTWLYINCDLQHISKASGIVRLLNELGVAKPRIAGIGDTTSDLPIREASAWFACPANAQPEMRDLADYVSPHEEAAGVVDILRQITGGN